MLSLPDNTNPDVIRIHVLDSFSRMFKLLNFLHVEEWSIKFHCLDRIFANELEIPFSKEEIKRSLMDAGEDKASIPDHFHLLSLGRVHFSS